jgi:hypothetical protein
MTNIAHGGTYPDSGLWLPITTHTPPYRADNGEGNE